MVCAGCSSPWTHPLGFFANFSANDEGGYNAVLLVVAPVEKETTQCSEVQISFPKFVLCVYVKINDGRILYNGGYCSTNKKDFFNVRGGISRMWFRPL